jgi:hypothetical protein
VQAALWNIPRESTDWNEWSFHHKVSHDLIRQGIAAKGGPTLTDYEIDPISPADMSGWLQRNSQLHIDMNSVLGLDSADLQDVDLSDERELVSWIALHAQQHRDAEAAAGVAS